MQGQSESQSSNTERLYYLRQEIPQWFPTRSSKAIEGNSGLDISS